MTVNNFANNITAPNLKIDNETRLTTVENKANDFYYNFLNFLYPVGSIYLSFENKNPADLFGFGTWEKITDRFLYCYNGSGNYGGSNEIPYHNHSVNITSDAGGSHSHTFSGNKINGKIGSGIYVWQIEQPGGKGTGPFSWEYVGNVGLNPSAGNTVYHCYCHFNATPSGTISTQDDHTHSISGNTEYAGDSNSTNNMPQYITVYAWKRVQGTNDPQNKPISDYTNFHCYTNISNNWTASQYFTGGIDGDNIGSHLSAVIENKIIQYMKAPTTAIKTAWLNIFYPVGSYYTSHNSTSPATLFGGTWERITNRFLFAIDPNNTTADPVSNTIYNSSGYTGGEWSHKLTINEMPNHNHEIRCGYGDNSPNADSFRYQFWGGSNNGWKTFLIQSKGGNANHNNMPPYITVYCWRRTA